MPRDLFDEINDRYNRRSNWDAVVPDDTDDEPAVDDTDDLFDDFSEDE